MTLQKRIDANGRNARKSTGPRTPEGKERSSRNALKHGLTATRVVMLDEDGDEFEGIRERLVEELAPGGGFPAILAGRIAAASWRLKRAAKIEREMMEEDLKNSLRRRGQNTGDPLAPAPTLGSAVREDFAGPNRYGKLGRYEAHIERGLYRAIRELRALRAEEAELQAFCSGIGVPGTTGGGPANG